MALKDIFTMVKANRYTADGREELIKAQESVTEDRRYKIGEISEKTGLQKTANGWVKPNKGKVPGAKTGEGKAPATKGTGTGTAKNEKWSKTKDYLGRERISMKTPQGGMVSIYETDNPKQKNNRFRVDTGTHADYFNTMEEAKAYAEKHHGEGSASKPAEETKTEATAKFETEQEKAKYEEGKKGWETVSKERLPDIKKNVEQKIDYYKKYDPYAMLGKRTGLNAAQKKAVEQNMIQAKENLAFFTGQLEGINEQMGASDSAPRVLTGDTKIRVRK